jgi:hypothetical protein
VGVTIERVERGSDYSTGVIFGCDPVQH